MRPRGPARQALRQVFDQVGGQPLTWRAMANYARVGFATARATVDNMARAGELRVVGHAPAAVGRPARLYAPAASAGADEPQAIAGDALVRCWHGVR